MGGRRDDVIKTNEDWPWTCSIMHTPDAEQRCLCVPPVDAAIRSKARHLLLQWL